MLVALTVAGSDSIGGAGIEADLKAFSSMGVHGTCVVTAVTSQNTMRVADILPMPVRHVTSQLAAVLDDAEVASAKTGMLYSARIAKAVARRLACENFPIVVDPVMIASVGNTLHQKHLVLALKTDIIPIAKVVTPNRHEAEALSDIPVRTLRDARKACEIICDMGAEAVVIKGGHFSTPEATDLLLHRGVFYEISAPRLPAHVHGGGCALSSFIAGNLARGMDVRQAVVASKSMITEAIRSSYAVGKGIAVVNPLAALEKEAGKFAVMSSLRKAVDEMLPLLEPSLIPEVGINFVYALPNATELGEVCGLDGRILSITGKARHCGGIAFGSSRHVAMIVLTAMRFDREKRSAMNIRYTPENLSKLRAAGLSIGSFDRRREPKGRKTMEWGTAKVIEKAGAVPDAIYDEGGLGKEAMIRLLGRDPEDVLAKMRRVVG